VPLHVKIGQQPVAGGGGMRAAFRGKMLLEQQPKEVKTCGRSSSFHVDMDAYSRQRMKATKEAALKELNKNFLDAV